MRATFPIITCDHEDGCDRWTLDWYEALASNWQELIPPGWRYNPRRADEPQLCPDHAAEAVAAWEERRADLERSARAAGLELS
jgi:hypothetical protein